VATYSYFSHVRRPAYRLVMESGGTFPPELDAKDWQINEERPYDRVHGEVMKDVERQGFGCFKQSIGFEEIPKA
jgi:hypothetical protein